MIGSICCFHRRKLSSVSFSEMERENAGGDGAAGVRYGGGSGGWVESDAGGGGWVEGELGLS